MRRAPTTDTDDPLVWMLHMVHHLGWGVGSTRQAEKLARGRSPWAGGRACALAMPDGQPLVIASSARELPEPRALFEAYEDLGDEHNALRNAMEKHNWTARYVVILAPSGHTQLVDLVQDEILVAAESRAHGQDVLLPLLDAGALMRGSLTSLTRKTPFRRGQELARWTTLWTTRLGSTIGVPREAAARFFQWLHLARAADLLGIGEGMPSPFVPNAKPSVRALETFFRVLAQDRNLLQGERLASMHALVTGASRAKLLAPCIQSLKRLSRTKFCAEIFAEAFADDALREKSWVASMSAATPSGPPTGNPSALAPCEVDLDEAGLVSLLRSFDCVIESIERVRTELSTQQELGETAGLQLDVFCEDSTVPAEDATARFVLEQGLVVLTSSHARADLARMVLLAHAARWNARLGNLRARYPEPRIHVEAPANPRAQPAGWSPASAMQN